MRVHILFPFFFGVFFSLLGSANSTTEETLDLDLRSLLDIEVTSVSKKSQPLSNAPAAIYVVTTEDIIRSGATSIPQALRGVPGLHVAQLGSQKWAISSRGFNGRYNNKLLVMMDGRTLYSPLFSGVYWEVQDTLMTDIERIEIIRGPGAAMWGANAVNGVINIITKHSADTIGGFAELGAGDYEQGFAGLRYGAELSEGVAGRVYAKGFKRDSLKHYEQDMKPYLHKIMMGIDTDNDWYQLQAGGRIDMQLNSASTLTVSSDTYRSEMNQTYHVPTEAPPYRIFDAATVENRGLNMSVRYSHALSANSEYSFQTYFDYVNRDEGQLAFSSKTVDLEFQHQTQLWQTNNIIWGLGFRYIADNLDAKAVLTTKNKKTDVRTWSAFFRDEITLLPNKVWLTIASRFEDNTYTGFEIQPNFRLMWQLNRKHKLWSSISMAVRTPSRVENNVTIDSINFPIPGSRVAKILVVGSDNYNSEEILSYELGYRFSPTPTLSFDLSAYYNDYDKLRGVKTASPDFGAFPIVILESEYDNSNDGYNYGFELSSAWTVSTALRFNFNYSYNDENFSGGQAQSTDAPKHMVSALADWSLTNDINLNVTWRYVDKVNALDGINFGSDKQIDSYNVFDVGLVWQITNGLSFSAFGKNLLGSDHVEYVPELFHIPYRVEPSYYGKITLKF